MYPVILAGKEKYMKQRFFILKTYLICIIRIEENKIFDYDVCALV